MFFTSRLSLLIFPVWMCSAYPALFGCSLPSLHVADAFLNGSENKNKYDFVMSESENISNCPIRIFTTSKGDASSPVRGGAYLSEMLGMDIGTCAAVKRGSAVRRALPDACLPIFRMVFSVNKEEIINYNVQ